MDRDITYANLPSFRTGYAYHIRYEWVFPAFASFPSHLNILVLTLETEVRSGCVINGLKSSLLM